MESPKDPKDIQPILVPNERTVFICSVCKSNFDDDNSIIHHMVAVHKDNKYIQQIRPKIPRYQVNTQKKVDEVKKKKVRLYRKLFNCTECTYHTKHMTTYKRHLKIHDKNSKKYNCPHCPFSAIQSHNVRIHVQSVHPV